MTLFIRTLIATAALLLAGFSQAGVVVVAHPSVPVSTLTADEVSQVYMGRTRTFPDGSVVTPLDQTEGSPARAAFIERVLRKNEQQLRSYWSRVIFTGKGQPPRSLAGGDALVRAVAATPGAIGYVDSKDVSPKVKVLLRVD